MLCFTEGLFVLHTKDLISKTPQVETMVQTEHECDLNRYIYLIVGFILGIAFGYYLTRSKH